MPSAFGGGGGGGVHTRVQDAVGRQALHGERAGHADALLVLEGAVVEVFVVRLGGDGGVDLPLPLDAPLPPLGMKPLGFLWPIGFRVARNLPLFPLLLEGLVELLAQGFQRGLVVVENDVDLGVVGDGLQCDVRYALIDEALADRALRRALGTCLARQFGLLLPSLGRIRQQVVRIAGAHDAGAGQGEGDAGGVDGDPTPPPLLGDVGGGAGTAGGV